MDTNTTKRLPEPEMTVAELLELWPSCVSVFTERRMACVGCDLSAFETLAGVARVYGVEEGQFLAALRAVAGQASGTRYGQEKSRFDYGG